MYKILTEASGSITSAFLINSIKDAGYGAVASDTDLECFGQFLADDFIENVIDIINEKISSLAEKETIENAIAACSGNIPQAAALLELSPSTIYRKRLAWQSN